MNLTGCITALVTPFDSRLEVDYDGLRRLVDFQIKNGVSGLAPLGTTGEAPTISSEERGRIILTVVERAAGRVPVIAGTGTNSTATTIAQTREAKELGADAALIVTPYYNKPSQEGIYRHFRAVAEAVDLPIIVYNIASRTGVNIETSTLLKLSKLENIVAVKEASGDICQMQQVINQLPKGFTVLSGDDNLTLPLIALGGKGVISVVGNLFPKQVSEMVRLALSGDLERARELHYRLLPIFKNAFIETNPVPIKTAMQLAGLPSGGVRLPLCELQSQNLKTLSETLNGYLEFNDLVREGKKVRR